MGKESAYNKILVLGIGLGILFVLIVVSNYWMSSVIQEEIPDGVMEIQAEKPMTVSQIPPIQPEPVRILDNDPLAPVKSPAPSAVLENKEALKGESGPIYELSSPSPILAQ